MRNPLSVFRIQNGVQNPGRYSEFGIRNSGYRIRKTVLVLISAFCLYPVAGMAAHKPLKIMIDPGHGGVDTGAAAGPVHEADIALNVALALRERLNHDSRFETFMTRDQDQVLTLTERVHKADKAHADLFLSIHANASPDSRAKGVEFYFQNQLPPDEEALFLASTENKLEKSKELTDEKTDLKKETDVLAIVDDLNRQNHIQHSFAWTKNLAESWKNNDRNGSHVIRQAPFVVISQSKRPAVLVEVGFLTHPQEALLLAQRTHQERIAENIYQGLVHFVEGQNFGRSP